VNASTLELDGVKWKCVGTGLGLGHVTFAVSGAGVYGEVTTGKSHTHFVRIENSYVTKPTLNPITKSTEITHGLAVHL